MVFAREICHFFLFHLIFKKNFQQIPTPSTGKIQPHSPRFFQKNLFITFDTLKSLF
jgi:hypothetical protein